jgi:hypothetical protein
MSSYSQKLQLRAQVADAFLDKFQLKPEEILILRGARDGALHLVCYYHVVSADFNVCLVHHIWGEKRKFIDLA